MTAAAVFHRNGVDVVNAGTDLAGNAVVRFREVDPNVCTTDVCHGVGHGPGDGEDVLVQGLHFLTVGVDVSHTLFGELNFQNKLCLQLFAFEIVRIKRTEHGGGIKSGVQQSRCQTEGAGGGAVIAEPTGVGDHAGVQGFGSQRGDLPAGLQRQSGDDTAAAFEAGVHSLRIGNGAGENVMIHTGGGGGQLITVIADQMRAAAVQNDGQRIVISLIGNHIHLRVFHKREKFCIIAHGKDLFLRIIFKKQVLQTDLAAHGITIGTVMPMQDQGVVFFNQIQYTFKHPFMLPFMKLAAIF